MILSKHTNDVTFPIRAHYIFKTYSAPFNVLDEIRFKYTSIDVAFRQRPYAILVFFFLRVWEKHADFCQLLDIENGKKNQTSFCQLESVHYLAHLNILDVYPVKTNASWEGRKVLERPSKSSDCFRSGGSLVGFVFLSSDSFLSSLPRTPRRKDTHAQESGCALAPISVKPVERDASMGLRYLTWMSGL